MLHVMVTCLLTLILLLISLYGSAFSQPPGTSKDASDISFNSFKRAYDVNIRDSIGNTPLSWAARFGYVDTVKLLLQKGANVNNASINNKTPLMEASEKGHYEIVELLIKSGASVNAQTKKGWSALMWAAEKGYIEIVSMLIEVDADLSARNNKGERALIIAQKNNHQETSKFIEEAETKKLIKKILFFSAIGITCTVLLFIAIKYFFILKKKRGRHSVEEKE